MKVTPIIMSAPMVRALIEGRKTVTRRIVKPKPTFIESSGRWKWPIPKRAQHPGCATDCYTASREWHAYMPANCCPYGSTGDLLWVRETCFSGFDNENKSVTTYRADLDETAASEYRGMWRPSIFMTREMSRLTLELSEVRVQRLQDISRTDAAEEGVCLDLDKPLPAWCRRDRWPEENYAALWESLNGKDSWALNPVVWCLSFSVHRQNIDAFIKAKEATAA